MYIHTLICLIAALCVSFCAIAQEATHQIYDNELDILQADMTTPGHEIQDLHNQDILISRDEDSYIVTMYLTYRDTLRAHTATYISPLEFNKAFYHWEADRKVAVRLHDTTSGESVDFKVFSKGKRSTGMEVPEQAVGNTYTLTVEAPARRDSVPFILYIHGQAGVREASFAATEEMTPFTRSFNSGEWVIIVRSTEEGSIVRSELQQIRDSEVMSSNSSVGDITVYHIFSDDNSGVFTMKN